jgi:hypothetical protein
MVQKIPEGPGKNPSPNPPPGGATPPAEKNSKAMQVAKYVFGVVIFLALVSLIF